MPVYLGFLAVGAAALAWAIALIVSACRRGEPWP